MFDGGDTNLYGYLLNDPIKYTDPSGLLFDGAINAGEDYGDCATQYWAEKSTDPNGTKLSRAAATAAGLFSSLWTTNTSDITFGVLTSAYTLRVIGPFPKGNVPNTIRRAREYVRFDSPHHGRGWEFDGKIPRAIGRWLNGK